jgi:AraC-like DNA-binding protein
VPNIQPSHDAVAVRQLAAELKLKGQPVKHLLAQAGLEARALNADGARIPFEKHAAFFELAAAATGDDCLGLHFGSTRDVRDAGLLGYVGLSSPTVAGAMNNIRRYRRVFSDAIEIETDELEESGQLRWWFRVPAAQRSFQALEYTTVNLLVAFRQMTGRNLTPEMVSLTHPRNHHIKEFERFFGCPVNFGRHENVIEFKLSDLHIPLLTADSRLLVILRAHCEDVLSRRSERTPTLEERVERLIAESLPRGGARLESAATELGMSPRSLSRKLAEQGTTFNAIVADLRKQLALKFIKDSNLVFTEIAFLLGYTEISTFSHAFKRWAGKSPAAYRRECGVE